MTIKDVAQYSGVSVSTVSRVLNERPDVSDSVRQKVLDAVSALHYVPNNAARDLVRPRSDSVGVVVRGTENPFFTSLIRAIEQSIAASGYTMVLHQIAADGDELQAGAELALSKRLLGLIFMGGRFDYTEEETARLSVPFVLCSFSNSFGAPGCRICPSVSIDDEAEAFRAVSLLTERGHRKIAVILNSTTDRSISELRYRGYLRALKAAGIEPDPSLVVETGRFDMEPAYEGAKALLVRRPDVTAIFTVADSMGIAAIKAVHESGRRIPGDCSIIAIDGIDVSRYTVPTLTTLIQPKEEMGRRSVEMLLGLIEGRDVSGQLYLPTSVREGGTIQVNPASRPDSITTTAKGGKSL